MTVDEILVDKMSSDKMTIDEITLDKMTVNKMKGDIVKGENMKGDKIILSYNKGLLKKRCLLKFGIFVVISTTIKIQKLCRKAKSDLEIDRVNDP
jgi:hypothetical protein